MNVPARGTLPGELVSSLPTEPDPVLDTEGTLEQYRQLDAQVLLIYGSETDPMFVDCAEACTRYFRIPQSCDCPG
jgi:hypothetical protein